MKHTVQPVFILAIALLFAGTTLAQGNRGRNDRNNDNGWRQHDYYGNKHTDRYDYRDGDRRDWDDRGRDDRYRDSRGRNDRYDYPVVKYRPVPPPHFNRGRQPSYHHVWMPGEYRWRNGGYTFHPGYWVVPPRRGMQYVPGYWQPARNGGYVWISGFWSDGRFSVRL